MELRLVLAQPSESKAIPNVIRHAQAHALGTCPEFRPFEVPGSDHLFLSAKAQKKRNHATQTALEPVRSFHTQTQR